MRSPIALLVLALGAAPAFSQGAVPLAGPYHLGRVHARHGATCGPMLDAIGAELGSVTFASNGTYSSSSIDHEVCQSGTATDLPGGGSGAYVVGSDGTMTLDPVPSPVRVSVGRDLLVLTWSSDSAGQDPYLAIATKAASGLDTSALSGSYHVGAFGFSNDGSGTRAMLWKGTITFSGGGAFGANLQQKSIDAVGVTTFTNPMPSGTCTIAGDGQLAFGGLPGAIAWNGAVAADGAFFFAVDAEGQDVALLVGLRYSVAATLDLPAGLRNGTNIHAALGAGPFVPELCSSSFQAVINGIAGTHFATSDEVCQSPSGSGVGHAVGGGSYTVNADGSSCVYEGMGGPCLPGAIDSTGDYAFHSTFNLPGAFDFSFHVRSPLPVVAVCAGDGSGTPCPCGNSSAPGGRRGCLNSLGFGGRLTASGGASLANDTLVLSGGDMPNSSALYFQGTTPQGGGGGAVFGDGLRCAAGSVIRLGTKMNSGNTSIYPAGGDPSVSVRGAVAAPGSRTYQVWYRNAAAFCTVSTFNLTNGLVVVWGA